METLLTDVISGLKTAGPFVMLLTYLWLSERAERRDLQKERAALLERVLKGLSDSASAVTSSNTLAESSKASIYSLRDLLLQRKGDPG